ncbi:BQ2448_3789 [Microbotryum intermedium]|uniref:BQ2448_3789 protein n=1 Tax=Microbotryum intermedium TaxID=269621 RepID=A0A238FCW9_9BASI|nr:BQ2448_3789 [Microbotryum intermedium]
MSDPAAQDAAATLSRVANSGAPIASTSTAASTSSAVLAAAALMAGSNPSASTSTSTHDNDTSHDTSHDAIPDPTLTAVASPNAQLPANYNKDLPMCANCLTQVSGPAIH